MISNNAKAPLKRGAFLFELYNETSCLQRQLFKIRHAAGQGKN